MEVQATKSPQMDLNVHRHRNQSTLEPRIRIKLPVLVVSQKTLANNSVDQVHHRISHSSLEVSALNRHRLSHCQNHRRRGSLRVQAAAA